MDTRNSLILLGRAVNWRAYCQLVKEIPWQPSPAVTEAADASWDAARVYPRHPAKTRQRPSYGRCEDMPTMGRY